MDFKPSPRNVLACTRKLAAQRIQDPTLYRSRPRSDIPQAIDVGAALEKMIYDDTTAGQTYELYGPRQYSMAQIHDIVSKEILKRRPVVKLPVWFAKALYLVLHRLIWWTEKTPDTVVREFLDQKIDPKALTFADLSIEPSEMTACTYEYLVGYRSNVYYDLPPMTEREKKEERKVSVDHLSGSILFDLG